MYQLSGLISGNTYYCRIRAVNGAGSIGNHGPSSNGIMVDTGIPAANKPYYPYINNYNTTGTVKWVWNPSTDTGSGIAGYYVYIGTTPTGFDVVNGAWTTNTWHQQSGLTDGNTYYCRIQAKNGVGTLSENSSASNVVIIE